MTRRLEAEISRPIVYVAGYRRNGRDSNLTQTIALAGALGLGWYLWRCKRADELGIALPSWMTFSSPSSSAFDLTKAAQLQMKLARQNDPLRTHTRAENINLFWSVATNDARAYIKTSWWLSVSSRLLGGNQRLQAAAASNLTKGTTRAAIPGGGYFKEDVIPIYRRTAMEIKTAARGNPVVNGVLATLGHQGTPAAVQSQAGYEWQRSATGIVTDTGVESARQVKDTTLSALDFMSGIVTGKRPGGMSRFRWMWMKWGTRAGIVALAIGGVAIAFPKQSQVVYRTAAPYAGRAARGAARAGRAGARAIAPLARHAAVAGASRAGQWGSDVADEAVRARREARRQRLRRELDSMGVR